MSKRLRTISKRIRPDFWLLVIIGVQLFFLVNLRFTAWPEMLSYAYLRNHGFLLYSDMVHPYPPLLTLILSFLFSFLGSHVWVLQIVAWSLAASNSLIIYWIFTKIDKQKWGLVAATVYALLQPFLEGDMLWFDFAISTPLLLGFLFCLAWQKNKSIRYLSFVSILFASSGLIKQTGGLFFIIFVFWLLIKKIKLKEFLVAMLSPLVLFIPLVISLLQNTSLQGFLDWVVIYPSKYWTGFPGYIQMDLTKSELLVLLALVAPIFLLIRPKKLFKEKILLLLIMFIGVGLLAVYPRFSFFHLQTVLPFLIIGSVLAFSRINNKLKMVGVLVIIFILFNYVFLPSFRFDWNKPVRFSESSDIALSQKISQITSQEEKIFLLGVHSGVYVYADRLPAKPWGDNFGWYYELPNVQEDTLARWQQSPPEHIFWQTPKQGNWYDLAVYQPEQIVEWIKANYTKQDQIADNVWHWKLK